MNKRGQIASTLTWIVAFGMIFFIIALFLVITMSVSGGKSLKIVDIFSVYGKNEISIFGEEVNVFDYNLNKELYSLMNEKVEYKGSEVRILDLFKYYSYSGEEGAYTAIDAKLKNYLDILYDECYSFCYEDNKNKIKQIKGEGCNNFDIACSSSNQLEFGSENMRGNYLSTSENGYEIKLYAKIQNGK